MAVKSPGLVPPQQRASPVLGRDGRGRWATAQRPSADEPDVSAVVERCIRRSVQQWIALGLHVAGMTGQGDQPFFTGTSTYTAAADWADVQAALTRTTWLRDIPAGIDRVTEKHFPDANAGGYLFGFGKLGAKTDVVGNRGGPTETAAPIFELRRMAGSIDHRVWATLALELFDYMVALDRRQQPTFTAPRRTPRT